MNLGMTEMIFLAVIGLLLFGPKKLPEIGRHIGKAMAEFRRASNEFKHQLDDEVRQLELEGSSNTLAPKQPASTASRVPIGTGDAPSETDLIAAESRPQDTGETAAEEPRG